MCKLNILNHDQRKFNNKTCCLILPLGATAYVRRNLNEKLAHSMWLCSVNEHFFFFVGSEHLRSQYQKPVLLITALRNTRVGMNRCSFSRAAAAWRIRQTECSAPKCDTPVPLYFAEPWWRHFKVNLQVSPGFPEVHHTAGTRNCVAVRYLHLWLVTSCVLCMKQERCYTMQGATPPCCMHSDAPVVAC